MPIIEEGSCMIYGERRVPIPAGFWPSMAALAKYVSDELGVTVEFSELPEPQPSDEEKVAAAELARKTEAGECTCECSCYSCDCDDCPFRYDSDAAN